MTTSPRIPLVAALAASLCLTAAACNQDEPATYQPESGDWTYEETTVVSNSCDANTDLGAPPSTFLLDYDGGDSFQVELGDEDLVCEIDGADFTCNEIRYTTGIPGFDGVLYLDVTWEGTFQAEDEVEGRETTRISCEGNDCDLAENLPCSVTVGFEAMAI